MVMRIKTLSLLLILGILSVLESCSDFRSAINNASAIRVEVPAGYLGWGYIIPVTDTEGIVIKLVDGKYQTDSNGVVYVAAAKFNSTKDNAIKVYDDGIDITNDLRYAESIYKDEGEDQVEHHIHFLIPSMEDRLIPNGDDHWRYGRYDYTQHDVYKYDSLLKQGIIVFK